MLITMPSQPSATEPNNECRIGSIIPKFDNFVLLTESCEAKFVEEGHICIPDYCGKKMPFPAGIKYFTRFNINR